MESYQCTFCEKKYVRKHAFDRHYLLCKNVSYTRTRRDISYEADDLTDSDFEKEIDVPSPTNMYKLILTILQRQDKIIQDIQQLKKGQQLQLKKIDTVSWLKHNMNPNTTFLRWTDSKLGILEGCHILETIFTNKQLKSGVTEMFHLMFQKNNQQPIQSFNHKQEIYIYDYFDNDNENADWIIWTNERVKLFIKRIHNYIIREFLRWSDTQKHIFTTDLQYYETVFVPRQNLIITDTIPISFVHDKIYNIIVQNSDKIVAYAPQ
jgi:hypothetical protein